MSRAQTPSVALETKIAYLCKPENYPEATSSVQYVETHMSCVFITDHFVYKMKKPIKLPFLDFTDLDDRKRFCEESLRLNRRLAARVYVAVVPLTLKAPNELCIGGTSQPVEWLEKMQRLPSELLLDNAIANHQVGPADVERFAVVLCDFYQQAPPVRISADSYLARFVDAIQLNHRELCDDRFKLNVSTIDATTQAQLKFLKDQPARLTERVTAGNIIEAHGDLRPEHICLCDPPVFIDCLEFDPELRVLDKADELAFLAMECEFAGAAFVRPVLFSVYNKVSGDAVPEELINFYASVRAMLRARLAAWHIKDHSKAEHPRWLGRAARYLALAARYAARL